MQAGFCCSATKGCCLRSLRLFEVHGENLYKSLTTKVEAKYCCFCLADKLRQKVLMYNPNLSFSSDGESCKSLDFMS